MKVIYLPTNKQRCVKTGEFLTVHLKIEESVAGTLKRCIICSSNEDQMMHTKSYAIVEQYEPEDILRAINEFQERHGAMRRRNRLQKASTAAQCKNPIKDH